MSKLRIEERSLKRIIRIRERKTRNGRFGQPIVVTFFGSIPECVIPKRALAHRPLLRVQGVFFLGQFSLSDPPLIEILDQNLQPRPDA
jgi:hypothetical protein